MKRTARCAAVAAACALCTLSPEARADLPPETDLETEVETETEIEGELEGEIEGETEIETTVPPAPPPEPAPLPSPEATKSEVPETEPLVERTAGLDDPYGPGYTGAPPAVAPEQEGIQEALYAQDVLKVATTAGFVATGVFGILAAINQPTAFGDGRCSDDGVPPDMGRGVGGRWGCDGLNIVHAALGVGTTLLYTAEQVTGLVIPGDEPDHGVAHQALTYVHVGGMVLTPVLGLLSANPRVFGIDDDADSDWPKVGRTIHMGVAVITAGAYLTTTLIELTSDKPRTQIETTATETCDPWSAL